METSLQLTMGRRNQIAEEVLAMAREKGVQAVDFKFTDLIGIWQHKSVQLSHVSTEIFSDGTGFDGSSIRGFQTIDESDMVLVADAGTAFIDPFPMQPTLSVTCDVVDPSGKNRYSKDPRHTAQKAEEYLVQSGIADSSGWGPEIEFFVFDGVGFSESKSHAEYRLHVEEDAVVTGSHGPAGHNLGHKLRNKSGYFRVPPSDSLQDVRAEMSSTMEQLGIDVEAHTHEVAAAQCEISVRYDTLTKMADKSMLYKYIVKNVAKRHGKTATFMPKPVFGDNGSGMHVHQSLSKSGRPLFYDGEGYAEFSRLGLNYIGGLLAHAPALMAFCAPSTNSYKRLVPGYEAPVNIAFGSRNRSAAVRIPMYVSGQQNAKSKRLEFRPPDPTCNPYLAFAAMLMAGVDGIKRKIDPIAEGFGPIDKNIYALPPEERAKVRSVPGSLRESLDALAADNSFLQEGGVFSKALIDSYIEIKREEADAVRIRPHPYEFYLYYDA
ncbi:MAG: type I glutamate--ammonia ligase [Candidatus Micrarchaeota archaeon]